MFLNHTNYNIMGFYQVANIRFYGISKVNSFEVTHYMMGDVHGHVMPSEIYSEKEILEKYPDAVKFKFTYGADMISIK